MDHLVSDLLFYTRAFLDTVYLVRIVSTDFWGFARPWFFFKFVFRVYYWIVAEDSS